ncbi:MAG TPA: hypothetical protein VG346_12075 [Acidimicrobiales bacterium]|jgi:hypothetical protein|nr:hypothetical protein [Acidimicrobiales bacterium]
MLRRLKWVAALLAGVVVLAGCNLAAKVVVQPNGSGFYSVIMAVPNAPSNPGRALLAAVRSGAARSKVPLTVTAYSANGSSGAKLTFHFLSLADLNAESHRLAASGSGGIGVTVDRDNHGWNFSASTANSLITPAASSGPGNSSLAKTLNSQINLALIVQLPGAPAENDARAVTHTATTSTFTWTLSSAQTGTGLQASTTYVGNQANVKLATAVTPVASGTSATVSSGLSGGTIALIAGAAVIVLGGGALAIVLRRRRHPAIAAEVVAPSEAD